MLTRRRWMATVVALAATRLSRRAHAAPAALEVAAPSNALAAIVAAEGGPAVVVRLDRALGPTELRLLQPSPPGGARHDVGGGLAVRRDILDDARNAPRLGAGVRKVLAAARPDLAAEFERNHRAFSHAFVRKVLAWNARLARSPHRGKRVINSVDRAALFAWAGVIVDPRGQPPPPALVKMARDAAEPTLASYVAYLDALVASLM